MGGRGQTIGRRVLASTAARVVAVVLLACAALYLARAPLLRAVGGFLVVDEPAGRADLIYLLSGDVHTRPFAAARLWHAGAAPVIVLAESETLPAARLGVVPTASRATLEVLRRLGVPDSVVRVLPYGQGATSTWDEADALRARFAGPDSTRVLVVTSDYHTRRARLAFRRRLQGSPIAIRMVAVEDPRFGPQDWWRSEVGLIYVLNEYIKLAHYALVGRP